MCVLDQLLLVARQVGQDVVLAGAVAREGGREVVLHVVVDLVDLDVGGVVVVGVLDRLDVVAGHPLDDLVGTVADDVLEAWSSRRRLGLDDVLGQRIGGVVGQRLEEERGRAFERDLERLVVDRLDAEVGGVDRHRAVGDLGAALDRVLQVGVVGGGRGIEQPAEGVLEVARPSPACRRST